MNKDQYESDEFDTSKKHVVEILLYSVLLSLLVSRDLLDLVTEQADTEIVFPPNAGRRPSGRTPSSFTTYSVSTSVNHYHSYWNG